MAQEVESNPPVLLRTGFVVLVDALGTKGVTANVHPDAVVLRWRKVLNEINKWTSSLENIADTQTKVARSIPFSDTIYICIDPPEDAVLDQIGLLEGFAKILYDALLDGVFLRGAVSYGRYYHEDTQVFGPAVEEAAAWYEEADWIGLSATPSMTHILNILCSYEDATLSSFICTKVPYKNPGLKGVDGWALVWPLGAPQAIVGSRQDVTNAIRMAFVRFGGTVPPSVYPKFLNSLNFVDVVYDVLEGKGAGK